MNSQFALEFWFQLPAKNWFQVSPEFDRDIEKQFLGVLKQAKACELFGWRETPSGRLAEILVLDQFSRNIYRSSAKAFEADPLALCLAQEAVRQGADRALKTPEKAFLYMPYMHSESLLIHETALALFSAPGLEENYKFEIRHHEILKRFGRYPHRNKFLGRESTSEEIEFLKTPGSSF